MYASTKTDYVGVSVFIPLIILIESWVQVKVANFVPIFSGPREVAQLLQRRPKHRELQRRGLRALRNLAYKGEICCDRIWRASVYAALSYGPPALTEKALLKIEGRGCHDVSGGGGSNTAPGDGEKYPLSRQVVTRDFINMSPGETDQSLLPPGIRT